MPDFFKDLFMWLGIIYLAMTALAIVAYWVSKFYDRWDVRTRKRLAAENKMLKRRLEEAEKQSNKKTNIQ